MNLKKKKQIAKRTLHTRNLKHKHIFKMNDFICFMHVCVSIYIKWYI